MILPFFYPGHSDYIVSRLSSKETTKELGLHVQKLFQNIGELPRYLVPTYFDKSFKKLYTLCIKHAWESMHFTNKGEFAKLLGLTSLQFVGIADGGALPAGGTYHDLIEDGKQFVSYSLSAGKCAAFHLILAITIYSIIL